MNNQFEGAELTIYTVDGDDFSLPLDALELAVMLKAIGFYKQGPNVTNFGKQTLMRILAGEINPFRLKDS